MSNWTYACCCDNDPCPDCSAANTCFDTSYVIPQVNLVYSFQFQAANVRPCNQCGQSCGHIGWTIEAQITGQDLVVTRVGGGGGQPCCYVWRGQLDVEYTLTVNAERRCVGTNCPRVWSETFTGTRTVDACIDVQCLECGNHEACGRTWTQEKVWAHSLRICDFDVTCNGSRSGLMGSNPYDPSGPLICLIYTTDCDPRVAEPCDDCAVPGRVWCAGGGVTYYSDLVALDLLSVSDMRCRGWGVLPPCGEDCGVPAVWGGGPFAAQFRDECDPTGEEQCAGLSWGGPLYNTRFGISQWDGWLSNVCGSVDESVTGFCIDRDILQSGCQGQGWVYT